MVSLEPQVLRTSCDHQAKRSKPVVADEGGEIGGHQHVDHRDKLGGVDGVACSEYAAREEAELEEQISSLHSSITIHKALLLRKFKPLRTLEV